MNHSTLPGSRFFVAVTALALSAGMAGSASWAAASSSFTESRGYQLCVDAAEQEERLVKVDASYFIYEHSDARRYYLNAFAFRDGDSVPIKIACDTTLGGHRLLDVSVDAGSYAGRLVEPVEVAGN